MLFPMLQYRFNVCIAFDGDKCIQVFIEFINVSVAGCKTIYAIEICLIFFILDTYLTSDLVVYNYYYQQ